MDIETLNQKNDFVKRTKILENFDDMVISKTSEGKTCIDIIKGEDVLAISLGRNSELIKRIKSTIDLSERHDHFPSNENPYRDTFEELRKVSYDVQLSINGQTSDKQTATENIWYGDGYYTKPKERGVEEGIIREEKYQIGKNFTGSHARVWNEFMPTEEFISAKRKEQTIQSPVITKLIMQEVLNNLSK